MPPFDLTVVPFLWSADPDSSVLEIGGADDDFFRAARTLLPIGEFAVDTHEPVFTSSTDAPPSLPPSGGEWEIAGWSEGGAKVFSLSFDMPRTVDGEGRSSFAFALPAHPEWSTALASITLAGPGGTRVALDADSDRPMTIFRDLATGRVLAIHRDPPRTTRATPEAWRRPLDAGPGVQALFSRGIPEAAAWDR